MKYWIAGSRMLYGTDWVDEKLTTLICWGASEFKTGGAIGIDRVAEWVIKNRQMGKLHPPLLPEWDKYGKAAGVIRNEEGVKWADIIVVFWDGESRGSKNVIKNAMKYKKELHVYIYEDKPL